MKKIILVGQAASGKDYLAKRLSSLGYIKDVGYTTRLPRQGEEDGKDYHFIDCEEFEYLSKEGLLITDLSFNGWRYGTTKDSFDDSDLFIMAPAAIAALERKIRDQCLIIYLDIAPEIRHDRLRQRNDNNDSIQRRIAADEADFKDFLNYDVKIINPDF